MWFSILGGVALAGRRWLSLPRKYGDCWPALFGRERPFDFSLRAQICGIFCFPRQGVELEFGVQTLYFAILPASRDPHVLRSGDPVVRSGKAVSKLGSAELLVSASR